jgi:competence protein ComEC
LTFCLIAGILFSHCFSITLIYTFYLTIGLFIILWITNRIARRTLHKTIWFGLVAYILMFALGILSYNTHHHKNFPKHYTKSKSLNNDNNLITFRIKERLKPTLYHHKYIVELIKINKKSSEGNLLLHIEKQNDSKLYDVDDILAIQSKFEDIRGPLNPNQFNYKAYLEKQYIYHQVFTEEQSIFEINLQRETIFGYADGLRQTINKRLRLFKFKPEELAIINALILGQRQDMDRDMYTDYANAGAIHILAVSGLHVGIILMMLNVVLKPIERLQRGKMVKVIIILSLLWSFAIVAGLSASVTRAVTMFSIVAIAMHLKRQNNIYNTLSISMFILLLVKPMFLFDVGFQMSYLAVFAIVSIQPLLHTLWLPKWKVIDYFWQIFTVTIAAQLGVLPISLFYFHQFPGLFFISNLAIIPFLGLILGFGILVILLSLLNLLPEPLANAYGSLISAMNHVVSWVSQQEEFLIKDISFDLSYVISTYLILLASILAYKTFNFKRIVFLLVSILMLQSVFINTKQNNQSEAFIIFHKSRFTVFGKKENTNLTIWHNLDSNSVKTQKMISDYKIGNFIKSIRYDTISNVYNTRTKRLLIIDSLAVYQVSFKPDYVLLRHSPKINLKRLIDSLKPELIIADGSNYKSYVKRWKATCIKEKLPFHETYEKGALILQ